MTRTNDLEEICFLAEIPFKWDYVKVIFSHLSTEYLNGRKFQAKECCFLFSENPSSKLNDIFIAPKTKDVKLSDVQKFEATKKLQLLV